MSSTPLPDHYKVLGVSKDAQVAEIRLAYRKLVLKCHPDKVQDPALKAQKQEEFQKVQQAYELLTDEEERRKYDDQVKLADLKEQLRKTNVSTPRSSSKYAEYEIRTTEPRASSYKASANVPPPASKGYTYPRSYEDDVSFSPRVYQTGASRTTRRETTYVDSRSKRDSERERERERDRDAREKEKDRERRKKAEKEEAARRAEDRGARRDKKAKEKQRDKDIKRDSEEKKKHSKPMATYMEDLSDDTPAPTPKSDKKKSSKKYDEKRDRDRSSHRDEIPIVSPPVRSFPEYTTSKYVELPRAVPAAPEPSSSWEDTHTKLKDATSYIEAARAKEGGGGLKRSMTYGPRMNQPPAAPTPPPAPNQPSPFAVPDAEDE
ncbi:domain containing, partial [Trichoderma arundinaceum]